MPFTLCHPAAVLPLLRRPFVPAALVAGTMAPDLPYYIPTEAGDAVVDASAWYAPALDPGATHEISGMFGMFGLDLLITAVLVGLFRLCRGPLPLLLPAGIAARLPAAETPGSPGISILWWAPLSALIGIATHIGWDATTKGAVATTFPFLRDRVLGSMNGLTLLSYMNTLVGALIIVCWLWRRRAAAPARPPRRLPLAARGAVLACLVTAACAAAAVPTPGGTSLRVLVVMTVAASAIVLISYAATWHVSQLIRRPAVSHHHETRRPYPPAPADEHTSRSA